MRIRRAAIADFERLKSIKLMSKKEEAMYSHTLKPIESIKDRYFSYLKRDLTIGNRAVFIAEENKEVVGMVLGKYFKPLSISRFDKKGHISNLYVVEGHRKSGIGEKLVLRAMEWLRQNDVRHIGLEVHVENRAACKFYKKLGFREYTIKLIKEQ